MRSFSKKLAFVLAAAMVVTAFAPAASAKAADEMAINKSSQILYVNEGINHKGGEVAAPGKGNVSVYDFNLKNKPADWKTAYSFAWSSSDENVVTVAKGGVATAVGVGKATVYCKVTEKATNEVTTLKTKVTVKANAYDVEISNADAWDGATVEVNDVVDLNRTMYDEDGNKTTKRGTLVTDYTKWVAEPATGVEINQKNGQFTFTDAAEAGEYKLYCYTYQSSKYTKATATADAVVVELVKAKNFVVDQTASNGFNLVFDQEASVAIADVTVEKIIKIGDSTGKIPVVVSGVTLSEDKKTASVSLFTNFENGVDYVISVKGYDEAVTLTAFVGAPKSMTISSKSNIQNGMFVNTSTPTDLTYTLFDEQGNNVTNTVTNGYVVYTAANPTSADYYVSGNSICIYKNGAEVGVNAEYHTLEFDVNGFETVIKGAGTFVGIDKTPDTISEISLNIERWGSGYPNNEIPVNDFQIDVKLKMKTTVWGDYLRDYTYGSAVSLIDTTNGINPPVVRFRSSNPDVLDLDAANQNQITLFKEGTAAILVELVTRNADGSENVNTITATYVTVIPKRVVTNVSVGDGATLIVGNVPGFNTEKITLNAVDQYNAPINCGAYDESTGQGTRLVDIKYAIDGTPIPAGTVTFEPRSGANGWQNKIVVNSDVMGSLEFPAGQNEISIPLVAKLVINEWRLDYAEREVRFRVVVKKPAGPEVLSVELGGATNGNVGRFVTPWDGNGNTEGLKVAQFKVFTKQNGVKTRQEQVYQKLTNDANAATAGALFYTVMHDGQDVTGYTNFDGNTVTLDFSATADQYMAMPDGNGVWNKIVSYRTGDNAKALGAGTYVFTLYKVVENATQTASSFAYVSASNVTVTCDAGSYSFVKRTSETANHTTNGVAYVYNPGAQYGNYDCANQAALRFAFEIKNRDGQVVGTDVPYWVEYVDAVNNVHVKSITFFECVDAENDVYAPYTVQVNTSLKK